MGRRMFLIFSFLILSAASIYLMTIAGERALSLSESDFLATTNDVSVYTSAQPKNENIISAPSSEKIQNNPSSANSQKEITTATDKKAKGKIVKRWIDPSAANLKYQKIYIKNTTSIKIDLKAELLKVPELQLSKTTAPQVLIVHTHTTECYMTEEREYYTESDKTRTTDTSQNIVAVGKVLADTLNKRGIGVIHATEKHDYPEYSGSYSRAEKTINSYLKKYPTIKVVIDLHRDSITDEKGNKTAPVVEINGGSAAQVMLVSGCQDGSVTGFENWRQNFRLAIGLQQTMEVLYPGLARPILFTPRRYNQHLTTGSLLIECGTEANTLEQAKYSATLLGEALANTLNAL